VPWVIEFDSGPAATAVVPRTSRTFAIRTKSGGLGYTRQLAGATFFPTDAEAHKALGEHYPEDARRQARVWLLP
jgi:hypothetical protein